ncbi:MAG: hypothetical protein NZL87_08035, partial [Thermomicrobium sp.]|nr:hypothetical protein [Thermomicrobium sp.]
GTIVLGLATASGVAGALADLAFYALGLDYLARLPETLAAIDEAAVREAVLRYLDPARMHVVIVGPGGETVPAGVERER